MKRRGQLLHSGSEARSVAAVFHRGYDLLDTEQLGFVASGKAAQAYGFRFDTRLRGNGGHRYGGELAAADKRALIEFLKTL